jgi:uncharacterized protein YjcR
MEYLVGMTPYRQKFKQMWTAGLTYAEIAAILRVTERCLYKWRVELGLDNRVRGKRKL